MTTLAILGHTKHGKTTLAEAIRGFGGPYQITDDGTCPPTTDIAILVVSITDGPMPTTRDAVKHLPEGAPKLVVLLNMLDQVEDSEIVDLVEMEVRELITAHGRRDGSATPVVRGSALRAGGATPGGSHKADRTLHDLFSAMNT